MSRGSWAPVGLRYSLALRQAEAACRQKPDIGPFLQTLGAAQYRSSQYVAALKTLTKSDQYYIDISKRRMVYHWVRLDLAFLAMTQFQLGHKADATATLGRFRDEIKNRPFSLEAEELLRETESLVDPKT